MLEIEQVQIAPKTPNLLPHLQVICIMSVQQSDSAIAGVEAIIGYRFKDRSLLMASSVISHLTGNIPSSGLV